MKRNEICYVAIVAIIGASLLLGFAEEVFHTDLGGLKWAGHWVSSPVALAIGFAFALLLCGISMGVMGKFVFVSGGKE